MSDTSVRIDSFDRILGAIDGLPDVRKTRPSTVTDVTPIIGDVQTYIVQTYATENGNVIALQMIAANGSYRLVVPAKAAQALYRQRDALIVSGRRARGRQRWEDMTEEQRANAVTRLRTATTTPRTPRKPRARRGSGRKEGS